MGASCCAQEKMDSETAMALYMNAGASGTEMEQLHGIARQHRNSQKRPTRNIREDARRWKLMQTLWSDSVQWQITEKTKTYAQPCPRGIHPRGSASVEVVATFQGGDFEQSELDAVAQDPLFVSKLLDQTGLDLYDNHRFALHCVPSNTESVMYSIHAECACSHEKT